DSARVVIESERGQCALWFFRLFFEVRDHAILVDRYATILLDCLWAADIVNGHGRLCLPRELDEVGQRFAEKVVSCYDEQIVLGKALAGQNQIDIPNGSQFVLIAF